jgi:periplasmic copper chaperone A
MRERVIGAAVLHGPPVARGPDSQRRERLKQHWMRSLGLAAVLLAGSCVAQARGLWVDQAWVRLLPGDLPAAGYFTLHNETDHAVQLVGVRCKDYGQAMMHRSDLHSGRMLPVRSVTVLPHGSVSFKPEGYHIMFMMPKVKLAPGSHVPVDLLLNNGQRLDADFTARGATGQ